MASNTEAPYVPITEFEGASYGSPNFGHQWGLALTLLLVFTGVVIIVALVVFPPKIRAAQAVQQAEAEKDRQRLLDYAAKEKERQKAAKGQ